VKYAGHVACCPLVSHVEHAPHALVTLHRKTLPALLRLKKEMGQADGRQTNALRLALDVASVKTFIENSDY